MSICRSAIALVLLLPTWLAAQDLTNFSPQAGLLVLRNGEATTFNVSTDKVSGDTIRAQVTVTALK